MNVGDIYLGPAGEEEKLSPIGRRLREQDIEIGREGRTFSGRKVKDVRVTKKEFTLTYSNIDYSALAQLRTLYNLKSELNLVVYYRTGETETYTVLLSPVGADRLFLEPQELWGGVTLLMEQV